VFVTLPQVRKSVGNLLREPEVRLKGRKRAESNFWQRKQKENNTTLVPSSGGKDSCYALYLCKTVYGLNPLTVTYDRVSSQISQEEYCNSYQSFRGEAFYLPWNPMLPRSCEYSWRRRATFARCASWRSQCELCNRGEIRIRLLVLGIRSKTDGSPRRT